MDRRQMALDCLEVERLGLSVLDFLREQGAISPWGTWWRLQREELDRERNRIRDGKETGMGRKQVLTPEVRAEAERMIAAGKDRKEIEAYLAANGSKNPNAHIFAIRKGMGKKTVTFGGKEFEKMEQIREPEKPKQEKPESAKPKEEKPEPKAHRPAIRIREADGSIGIWRRAGENAVSFRFPASGPGEEDQEMELTAEEWMILTAELPSVMEVFGIGKGAAAE